MKFKLWCKRLNSVSWIKKMTKFIAKKQNHTALFLTNIHANFEGNVKALNGINPKHQLFIKEDPISKLHIQVVDSKQPHRLVRVEKQDIKNANSDRQALYHLFATVLNELEIKG